jgi:hypothetical protein
MQSKNLILLLSLAVFIFLGFSTQTVSVNDNNKPLRSVIGDGALLMDFGIFDDEGRLLVWSLAVKGDVDGYMVWWFDMPFAEPLVTHRRL